MTHPSPSFRLFLLAGEASGDAYGAELIQSLQAECANQGINLDIRGWGGDLMEQAGMTLLTHIRKTSFMGFWEVVQHLPTILSNLRRAESDVLAFQPDAIVFIDFPGFNMRLARRLRRRNHDAKRIQWVAPQVWAWKPGRIHDLARDCHVVAPILPFESAPLKEAGVQDVWETGHPLLDMLPASTQDRDIPLVLLPGSRAQELERHLPVMISAIEEGARQGRWSVKDVCIAGAPGKSPKDYQLAIAKGIAVHFSQTHELLSKAQFAWVASGTATLEAALLGTPHLIAYKTSPLTFAIAKRLARIEHIGLPNLLMGRTIVPELIQRDMTPQALLEHTTNEDPTPAFASLRQQLGGPGAIKRMAQRLVALR